MRIDLLSIELKRAFELNQREARNGFFGVSLLLLYSVAIYCWEWNPNPTLSIPLNIPRKNRPYYGHFDALFAAQAVVLFKGADQKKI